MRPQARVGAFMVAALLAAGVALLDAQAPSPAAQGQARPGAPTPSAVPGRQTPSVRPEGTGVITGRVVSTEGRVLRGAHVMVYSTGFRDRWGARAKDDGTFEVTRLPQGEFTINANKPGYVSLSYGARKSGDAGRKVRVADGQKVEKVDFQLPRACVIAGVVLDEYGEPAGGASVEPMKRVAIGGRRRLMAMDFGKQTDDLGRFRLHGLDPGDYFVRASLQASYGTVSDDRSAHPPTFYPGVTSLSEAATVSCRAGQETPGIQVALSRTSTVTVSGQVFDSAGKPVRTSVMLLQPDEVGLATNISAMTRADGSFTLSSVASGTYHLVAQTMGAAMAADREVASIELTVGGRDINGLVLQLSRGATLRGRVVADGDATFDFPLNRLRVGAAIEFDTAFLVGSGNGLVKEDGTFEVTGLLGSKRLQAYGFPDTWMLKAIRGKNGDVTDQRLAFGAGETHDGFEVVLTNRVTTVTGSVTDDQKRPVKDYAVGIFSEDPAHWGFSTGRVMTVRSDQDGRYEVKGLQPGRYLAVALPEVNNEEFIDSEYLERLRPLATSLTLSEGEANSLNLRLITGM